jgi:trehalose 6-phosphate phosphatase
VTGEVETRLREIADTERLLVALDFDGTLSPHEDDPMAARMLPAARHALDRLSALPSTTVALVSGRSLPDLREISEHRDRSPWLLSGSHGAEWWVPGEGAVEPEVDPADTQLRDRLRERLIADLETVKGAWIEPKTFGFAVHTRLASPQDEERAQGIADELLSAEAPGWRRRTGRNIVEYAFRDEGKDTAVAALRERTGATAVLFAGDDVTDEDALRSLAPGDLGVHVGERDTAAHVSVPDIASFADLLERLATERASRRQ